MSPTNKRKRSTESASPDSRRSKRGAPAAAMGDSDAVTAAFIESAVNAAQAAQEHVNVDDFSALQQAAAEHTEGVDHTNASSTAAAALGSMYPTLHVPQSTEETFASQAGEVDHHGDASFNTSAVSQNDGLTSDSLPVASAPQAPMQSPNGVPEPRYTPTHNTKPAVGSEEWHKMRKDNHKEVERRRRETINEGINELSKIVPGCEKNKGSILHRAVAFITQLKQNEERNIEKWTLEKILTEQAIDELSASNDKLKQECERLYRELETWKKVAQNAGLQPTAQKEESNLTG
ncbi:hypothetical protein VTK73DRAFT_7464 [Phialemonium thermophilum]|uniref:BHLH domain-containing protein n=1 Tax=Phialemonium thermophilum TaxID=223376 RepID=A0ABR3XS59_9PEZI